MDKNNTKKIRTVMSSDRSIVHNGLDGEIAEDQMMEQEKGQSSPQLLGLSYWIWGIITIVVILVIVLLVLWYKGYFSSDSSTGTTNPSVNNPSIPTNIAVNTAAVPTGGPIISPAVGPTNRRTYSTVSTSLDGQKLYLWTDRDRKIFLKSTPANYDITFNSDHSISFNDGTGLYILVCDANGYNVRIIPAELESQGNVQRVMAWNLKDEPIGVYRLFNPGGSILYSKYDQAIKGYQLAFTGNDKAKSEGWQLSTYTVERIQ